MPVAAPAVLPRVLHHVGADRVEFDVAHAGEEVGFCLDQAGFVAAFPQAAGAALAAVDVLHVAATNSLHELGCASLCFGCNQQVDVVGHEYISVDGTVPIGSRFLQPVKITEVILIGEKAGLPVDSALNYMLRHSG